MRALSRKLWREIWRQRGQMLSIAAVVAVGIMVVLTLRGAYDSLVVSQDVYYRESRMPTIWAELRRAPQSVRGRIAALPGVTGVDTRVTFTATLDIPGLAAPGQGRLVSVPARRDSMLGDITITEGRYVSARRGEVIVSQKFADANGFTPGDSLEAVINGQLRTLRIVGAALSPEHTYSVPPGALFPDNERYGVLWMSRNELGPAYDMEGAFNQVVLTTTPGADMERLIAQIDRLLEPYGGLGAYTREIQQSHQILQSELDSNRTMGTAIPAVFLGVAAFLLNLVLGRMIATQRTEIAVLKAFGYSNFRVGWHYFMFAMVAVMAGTVVGIGTGIWLGRAMMQLYGEYFSFPTLRFELSPLLILIGVGASALAAGAGALNAVRRAVTLPPAEAMRPEPPATFRPGLFERLGLGRALPSAGRLILRNIERQPIRTVFAVVGVSFSVAILVIGLFMFDGIGYMMDLQFRTAQREDLSVSFNRPLSPRARYDLAHLTGVQRVEPYRSVPVRLHAGQRDREAAITGLEPDTRLRQIVTVNGQTQPVPTEGLVISDLLADRLGVSTGDMLRVEVLEGARRTAEVPVAGIVGDLIGVSVYANMDTLERIAGGGPTLSGAYLQVDGSQRETLDSRLKELPAIASVASPQQMLDSFEEQLADSLYITIFFVLGFSGVIAVAVIYNGARIALSERGRELASLRVLGFTRNEVAVLLLGEQAISTILAIPLGWLVGFGLAGALTAGLQTETYRIPLIIHPQTYAVAALITVVAAMASGWIVRRKLDRMDLIEVLKTRE